MNQDPNLAKVRSLDVNLPFAFGTGNLVTMALARQKPRGITQAIGCGVIAVTFLIATHRNFNDKKLEGHTMGLTGSLMMVWASQFSWTRSRMVVGSPYAAFGLGVLATAYHGMNLYQEV